ncbi:MAG: ATP-dependent protease ATPase subunit HslU [Holosporales bacterium]|jgi:ATP-dependent HslUV protease ATP-binding subunit HslU|nr:ATP-dependent protease ATPase subunit HslU [Holosporales bacterium]
MQCPFDLTPEQIIAELDRHIVGQRDAKKAVAIALRNRWRRMRLSSPLREEVLPKNILMVGTTGVGKTEIARRLARLVKAPFIKVEATKFTEIGYVGRDVEQIIRDLLDVAIKMMTQQAKENVVLAAMEQTESRILDALTGVGANLETRLRFKQKLQSGELDNSVIDIKVVDTPVHTTDIPGIPGNAGGSINFADVFSQVLGKDKLTTKKMSINDARRIIMQEESEKLIDQSTIVADAIEAVEQNGIVFIDEIDKICAMRDNARTSSVSQDGVQRDLLPIIEGTSVTTKYGPVQTDHILFIAAGAFQAVSPSDLLQELQGRLPVRVNLQSLTKDDFVKILTEPESNLIRQSVALLETEGVTLTFDADAIEQLADVAVEMNNAVENIGARRLYTVLEYLLEDVNFDAPKKAGEVVNITKEFVDTKLASMTRKNDLHKFVL